MHLCTSMSSAFCHSNGNRTRKIQYISVTVHTAPVSWNTRGANKPPSSSSSSSSSPPVIVAPTVASPSHYREGEPGGGGGPRIKVITPVAAPRQEGFTQIVIPNNCSLRVCLYCVIYPHLVILFYRTLRQQSLRPSGLLKYSPQLK